METSCRRLALRKSVPEFRSRKVYCGFPGVCSYLLDVCILVSEFMSVHYQFVRTLMTYVVAVGSA